MATKKTTTKKTSPAKKTVSVKAKKTAKKVVTKTSAKKVPAVKTIKAKAAPKKKAPAKTKKIAPEKNIKSENAVIKATSHPVDHEAYLLAKTIVNAILEKKGENIVCLDLRNIENRVCDYFIICEGNSSTQIDAIASSVEFMVKTELSERPYRSEGWANALWILIDYVNVVVHVFDRETRHFYNLESLWADGEIVSFEGKSKRA
jgi:ribosome-associated protein